MTPRTTWIASYPKSGNTWVRALLLHYLAPPGAPVSLHDLHAIPLAASRPQFEQALGCDSALLLPHEIATLQSAWYNQCALPTRGPAFFKLHDQFNPRLHTPANSRLIVYIVRNPWDVAVSYAAHRGQPLDEIIDLLANPVHIAALAPHERPFQLPQFYGSWSGHAASWLDQTSIPVHLLRYEDLLAHPVPIFAGLLHACGYPVDAPRLAAAIEACSFARLRAREEQHGFPEKPPTASRFFRQGRAGTWRDTLTPQQASRIARAHAPALARLGYTAPGGYPS
ncbi:MAG: sulfotransferase domain-containing protein [Acidobacteriota bacterium]